MVTMHNFNDPFYGGLLFLLKFTFFNESYQYRENIIKKQLFKSSIFDNLENNSIVLRITFKV